MPFPRPAAFNLRFPTPSPFAFPPFPHTQTTTSSLSPAVGDRPLRGAMTAHSRSRLCVAHREGVQEQETEPGTLVTGQVSHRAPLCAGAPAGDQSQAPTPDARVLPQGPSMGCCSLAVHPPPTLESTATLSPGRLAANVASPASTPKASATAPLNAFPLHQDQDPWYTTK